MPSWHRYKLWRWDLNLLFTLIAHKPVSSVFYLPIPSTFIRSSCAFHQIWAHHGPTAFPWFMPDTVHDGEKETRVNSKWPPLHLSPQSPFFGLACLRILTSWPFVHLVNSFSVRPLISLLISEELAGYPCCSPAILHIPLLALILAHLIYFLINYKNI